MCHGIPLFLLVPGVYDMIHCRVSVLKENNDQDSQGTQNPEYL